MDIVPHAGKHVNRSVSIYLGDKRVYSDGMRGVEDWTVTTGGEMDANDLAALVTQRREQLGINKSELARRAGLRPTYIGRIEGAEIKSPSGNNLRKLAAGLGWPPGRLLPPDQPLAPDDPAVVAERLARIEETLNRLPPIEQIEQAIAGYPHLEQVLAQFVVSGVVDESKHLVLSGDAEVLADLSEFYHRPGYTEGLVPVELVRVPRYAVRVAADLSRHLLAPDNDDRPEEVVTMPAAALPRTSNRLVILAVEGDCMAPLVRSGDQIIVEVGAREWQPGQVVVARAGDALHCKRLERDQDGSWWLAPRNGSGRLRVDDSVEIVALVHGAIVDRTVSTYVPWTTAH